MVLQCNSQRHEYQISKNSQIIYTRSQAQLPNLTNIQDFKQELSFRIQIKEHGLVIIHQFQYGPIITQIQDQLDLVTFLNEKYQPLQNQSLNAANIVFQKPLTFLMKNSICCLTFGREIIRQNSSQGLITQEKIIQIQQGVLVSKQFAYGQQKINFVYQFQVLVGGSTFNQSVLYDQESQKSIHTLLEAQFTEKKLYREDEYQSDITLQDDDYFKRFHRQKGKGKLKGDKKNVVKNFVKAFRTFLCQTGDIQELNKIYQLENTCQLNEIRKEWIELEKRSKYNNAFVKQLFFDKKFSGIFIYFLQEKATEWLKQSGVVDKKSHGEVLKIYIKASHDRYELDKIICLKSRTDKQ